MATPASESPVSTISSVGSDVRKLRKRRMMTITQLAARLDRSIGFISQIERGLSQPSIEDLRTIAQVFDVPISFFFGNDTVPGTAEAQHVVRADKRRELGNSEGALFEQLLSPDLGGSFETLLSEFKPGAELSDYQQRDTEEAGYVVSGVFELNINGYWHVLHTGDSFRFAGEPYRWRNTGKVSAVLVWIISPPIY